MLLSDAISDLLRGDNLRLRTATVSSATTTRATITLAGASISNVPFLASYTPAVGNVVLVLQAGSQLIIIGKAA